MTVLLGVVLKGVSDRYYLEYAQRTTLDARRSRGVWEGYDPRDRHEAKATHAPSSRVCRGQRPIRVSWTERTRGSGEWGVADHGDGSPQQARRERGLRLANGSPAQRHERGG